MKNVIICGYPGIGKSTLSKNNLNYIDYDTSTFRSENKDLDDNWQEKYCKKVIELSNSNHIIFTSTHKEVRDYFSNHWFNNNDHILIYITPSLELKEKWINKLEKRCNAYDSNNDINSELVKNIKALGRAVNNYENDIYDIINSANIMNVKLIIINSMNYNLDQLINNELNR